MYIPGKQVHDCGKFIYLFITKLTDPKYLFGTLKHEKKENRFLFPAATAI